MEKVGFELPPLWDFLNCHAWTPGDASMVLLVHPEAAPSFIEDEFVFFCAVRPLWVGWNFMSGFLLTGDVCDNFSNLRSAHE